MPTQNNSDLPTIPPVGGLADTPFSVGNDSVNKLVDRLTTDQPGQPRVQLWPERMLRDALAAPHDVYNSKVPLTSEDLIKPAMDMAAVAGTGGLGGVGEGAEAALGAGPFLRPALKYQGKIYKAPVNGQHLDAIPPNLRDEFTRQAMSGEDISNFNFGFLNHKGHFLDRGDALKYAIDNGLLDPHSARYGALTSTMDLMADSSKPGTAVQLSKQLQKLKDQGYNVDEPVFHQSNTTFNKIKPSYGSQVWFSTSKDALANNGASGTGKIATAYLKYNKLAGWPEYDKFTTDELLQQGYDGARLDNDIVMFKPENVKIHSWEDAGKQ